MSSGYSQEDSQRETGRYQRRYNDMAYGSAPQRPFPLEMAPSVRQSDYRPIPDRALPDRTLPARPVMVEHTERDHAYSPLRPEYPRSVARDFAQPFSPPPDVPSPIHRTAPTPTRVEPAKTGTTGVGSATGTTPQTSTVITGGRTGTPHTEVTGSGSSDPVNLADKLEALQLTSFYVRPGFGNEGRPLTVKSNYYAVRPIGGRGKIIYHYDVDIVPVVKVSNQKLPRTLLRSVWEQLVLEQTSESWLPGFEAAAFDGRRNVFTPTKFPIATGDTVVLQTALNPNREVVKVKRDDSSSDDEYRRFRVGFKLVAKIDLEHVMQFCKADQNTPRSEEAALTGLTATNILLRDIPSKTYAQVGATGNKFYTIEGARPIPQGAVVCRGFLQSFRYSNSGLPLINLDLGFSAFLSSGPALEVVARILGTGPGGMRGGPGGPAMSFDFLNDQQISILKRKLRGAKFTVTHRQSTRLHTVISVTLKPACEVSFTLEGKDGQAREVNVADYYREYYGTPVRKPRLPCIQYGKRAYIPLEFVNLADFNSLPPTNLTAEQTAEMIKISAIKPDERSRAVDAWRRELAYEKQKKIALWGLQVNTQMVEVKARILAAPTVQYRGRTANTDNGSWRIRGMQFLRPVNRPLTNWAFISFDRYMDVSDMKRYVAFLVQILTRFGVNIANRDPPCIAPSDPRDPANLIGGLQLAAREAYLVSKETPQLICVILPGRDAWLYETIKRLSFTELKAPVATQCMQALKLKQQRGIDAYTDNLAMKIVNKLGGLSHGVAANNLPGVVEGKTMILGADLGHPPFRPNSEEPTVACSIATYNANCDAFSAQIRLQEGRSEIIADLSGMVEEHLRIFAKHNEGEYPERILIFRDGISEGQYAATLQYEHDAVVRACARILPGYRPRILVCVCAKRHNTRFFGQPRNCDPKGNLPAGLVVDSTVTHPYAFDFFLQAHRGMVGTARPTHYICLLDELAMTPDQLQKLVNSLCYSFGRCTSSVSLVPVCYMADLVCQKARVIVQRGGSTAYSETSGTRSHWRGGNRDDRSQATTTTKFEERFDIFQIQKLLARNPDLAQVGWWM